MVVSLLATLALAAPAQGAPTAVVFPPLAADDGDAVEVSGSGCGGPVDVTLSVPDAAGTGTEVADQASVVPAGDGSWSATLTMQGGAAVVVATCDGTTSAPSVVGAGGSQGHVLGYARWDGTVVRASRASTPAAR